MVVDRHDRRLDARVAIDAELSERHAADHDDRGDEHRGEDRAADADFCEFLHDVSSAYRTPGRCASGRAGPSSDARAGTCRADRDHCAPSYRSARFDVATRSPSLIPVRIFVLSAWFCRAASCTTRTRALFSLSTTKTRNELVLTSSIDRALRHEHRPLGAPLIDRRDGEHAGLELPVRVRHPRFDDERSRLGGDLRVDGADLALRTSCPGRHRPWRSRPGRRRSGPACTLGIVSCRRSGSMRSSVTTAVDGWTNSPSDDSPLADVSGEGRDHDDVGDRLLGERQLGARLGQRGAGDEHAVARRSPPASAPRRPWSAGSGRPCRSASLRCAVVCASAFCDSASFRFASARATAARDSVEPEVGVDRLDANQHRALGDMLPDVDRRRDRPGRSSPGATSDDSSAWKLPVASMITGSSTPLTGATATAAGARGSTVGRRAFGPFTTGTGKYEGKACDAGGERRSTNAHQ